MYKTTTTPSHKSYTNSLISHWFVAANKILSHRLYSTRHDPMHACKLLQHLYIYTTCHVNMHAVTLVQHASYM